MQVELVYLRAGNPPKNGRSKNYLTGKLEAGVSVYEGFIRDNKAFVLLPKATGSACVGARVLTRRPTYQVKGDVVGRGSDGEPVLANCRIVRPIELYRSVFNSVYFTQAERDKMNKHGHSKTLQNADCRLYDLMHFYGGDLSRIKAKLKESLTPEPQRTVCVYEGIVRDGKVLLAFPHAPESWVCNNMINFIWHYQHCLYSIQGDAIGRNIESRLILAVSQIDERVKLYGAEEFELNHMLRKPVCG